MKTLDLHTVPPLGETPEKMKAIVIRKEREGDPITSMQVEEVPVPELGPSDVLVLVMAAGVNFNGVWAAQGKPVSVFRMHKDPFHIAGSDASGIVWKVGDQVKRWKAGDQANVPARQPDQVTGPGNTRCQYPTSIHRPNLQPTSLKWATLTKPNFS